MLRLQQHPWWLLEAVHELKPALPLSSTSGICSSSAAILPLTWWPFSVKMAAVWTKQHAGQKDWGLVGFKQMRNSWRNLSVRILYLGTWQTHLDERIIQNQDISATLHLILQNMLISVSLKWRLFHINITLREKHLYFILCIIVDFVVSAYRNRLRCQFDLSVCCRETEGWSGESSMMPWQRNLHL